MGNEGLRVDLHVKVLNDRIVRRAKTRGLDVLVYAPHFTRLQAIEQRAGRYSDDELLVIPGREVFTGTWRNRKHVLGIGLSAPIPDFISLDGAMDALTEQGAAILVPHPDFMTVSLDRADLERYSGSIHAIETYNPKHLPIHNRRARAHRERLSLPAFASSYAHLPGSVGEVWTTFEGVDRTPEAVASAVVDAAPRTMGHRTGVTHRVRCAGEFAHLFVENTWQKFDRVVLSGQESTHPDHPAYGGRFDDVASY